MRFHRIAQAFEPWHDAATIERLLRAEALAAVRYEPALRQGRASGFLDLTFMTNDETLVLPVVYIDNVNLIEEESDPLLWPAAVHDAVSDAATDAVSERIMPWLRSYAMSRQLNEELVEIFAGGALRDRFFDARSRDFLGAAPFARVIAQSAPYAYAVRFARNRAIGIRDPHGAAGAVLLRRFARSVRADLGDPSADAAAAAWYGCDIFGPVEEAALNVLIASDAGAVPVEFGGVAIAPGIEGTAVRVTAPVPLEILYSFDPQDGPQAGEFAVRAPHTREPRTPRGGTPPPPSGGSTGRILIALPPRFDRIPDADSDSALELARRLREEGFEVEVAVSPRGLDLERFDVVHIFSAGYVDDGLSMAAAARSASVPVVITANLEDIADRAWWGANVTPVCFKNVADEQGLQNYLELLANRRLSTPEFTPDERQAPAPDFEAKVAALLEQAGCVIVSGDQERTLLAERFGRRKNVVAVAPYLNTSTPASPIEAVAGYDDFVLVHAPLEPRSNQLIVARAAQRAGLPLVLAGPVADADYLERVREFSGPRVILIPDPRADELAALYRRARIFADVSWIGVGLWRLAQAAACGCALVVSRHSYAPALWGQGLWVADPASEASVAVALGDAWAHVGESPAAVLDTADRIVAASDPAVALAGTLAAYLQAPS